MEDDIQYLLAPYKDISFLFWTFKRTGNPVHVSFKVIEIKKISPKGVVLNGEIMFAQQNSSGEIEIDFSLDESGDHVTKVCFRCKSDRYKYLLTPNVNTEDTWNELVSALYLQYKNDY